MVVPMVPMGFMCGGFDGVPMGIVAELWLISGFVELWLNEHAC